MSFAKTVKEELVTIPVELEGQLAECAAFLNLNTELHIENRQKRLDFKTNNPTVAKRFLQLIRVLYQPEIQLITQKQTKLKKRQTVIVSIQSKVEDILNEHSLLENNLEAEELLTQSPEAKKAYLRACFLSSGSMNHPKTAEYHLEISSNNANQTIFIQGLMNSFELNAKITTRRNGYIVYLKDAEGISMFLQIVGAQNALFQYEDIRIKRDFNNSINRVINCEVANEKKTLEAARDQMNDIKLIDKYVRKDQIDPKVKRIIDLRKQYPDISLRELSDEYASKYHETISKSGLNHRIQKIKQLAMDVKKSRKLS